MDSPSRQSLHGCHGVKSRGWLEGGTEHQENYHVDLSGKSELLRKRAISYASSVQCRNTKSSGCWE